MVCYGVLGKGMGLVDQIKMAASVGVVEKLLEQGTKFTMASPKTQRRWKYVAVKRLKDLQLQAEKQTAQEKKAEQTEKPARRTYKQKT